MQQSICIVSILERSRSKRANVCWKFQIEPGFKFASVKIKMKYSIFQPDARLNLKLHCDDETDIGVLGNLERFSTHTQLATVFAY